MQYQRPVLPVSIPLLGRITALAFSTYRWDESPPLHSTRIVGTNHRPCILHVSSNLHPMPKTFRLSHAGTTAIIRGFIPRTLPHCAIFCRMTTSRFCQNLNSMKQLPTPSWGARRRGRCSGRNNRAESSTNGLDCKGV